VVFAALVSAACAAAIKGSATMPRDAAAAQPARA
jgi:hypothetical protein